MGNFRKGSICVQSLSSDSNIHGMKDGLLDLSNRCFPTKLGQKGALRCIFPCFIDKKKVLLKVKTERALMILVTPNWLVQLL